MFIDYYQFKQLISAKETCIFNGTLMSPNIESTGVIRFQGVKNPRIIIHIPEIWCKSIYLVKNLIVVLNYSYDFFNKHGVIFILRLN